MNVDTGPSILEEEIRAAIGKMKRGKSIGGDGVAVEMIEALGDFGVEKIAEIANQICLKALAMHSIIISAVLLPTYRMIFRTLM